MKTLGFIIGCFILIGSVLISGSVAEESLDPFLVKVGKGLESTLGKIQNLQKEMGAAVQEVHLAQQELENSGGFFPPILAQERLRNARKKHHELSQNLKDSRRDLGLLMRTIRQRIMKETSGFDQQIQELDRQIETANPKQAEKLKKQRNELDQQRQAIKQKFEDHLGRFGASIRQVMRWQEPDAPGSEKGFGPVGPQGPGFRSQHPFFDPEDGGPFPFDMQPPPMPDPDQVPPEDFSRNPEMRRSRGWPFLQQYQKKNEELEGRIENLEAQIDRLKKRIQQLETKQD